MTVTTRRAGGRPSSRTAGGAAYEHLKRHILTCRLEPATEIREAELAQETGFGRTPIRDALARLAHEGLVEVRPRQGYRVKDITLDSVREAYELRLLIEPAGVEMAIARATDNQLTELHDLAHAKYDHNNPDTYEEFIRTNREFHVRLAACGNQRLAQILERLMEDMQRLHFRSLSARDTADLQVHEHHSLYDAVLARDVQRAREICIQQIRGSQDRVVETLLGGATATSSWNSPPTPLV